MVHSAVWRGVERVFGRKSAFDVRAELNMISYDEFDLDCLTEDDMLKKDSDISKVYGGNNNVLAAWDKDSPFPKFTLLRQLSGNEAALLLSFFPLQIFSFHHIANQIQQKQQQPG